MGRRAHRPCCPCRPERRSEALAPLVILSGGGASRRSRRTSLAAKACGGGGRILVGKRAALPGCADLDEKRLRPAEKRRSRADGQMCPSTLLLMVRPPAGSPYETSTNRRACGSKRAPDPWLARGLRPNRPEAIGAGFVRLVASRARTRPVGAPRPALARTPQRGWSRNPFREGSGGVER